MCKPPRQGRAALLFELKGMQASPSRSISMPVDLYAGRSLCRSRMRRLDREAAGSRRPRPMVRFAYIRIHGPQQAAFDKALEAGRLY